MNQERIGKFIAESRKQKKMTQSHLAEKLGVTEKSISNWENGRNMPDLSLFKPLCDELDITINDLLSGEKIDKGNYQEKLEENIVNTIAYTNKKINEKNNKIGLILLVLSFMIIVTAFSIFPSESSWGSLFSILGIFSFFNGLNYLLPKLTYIKKIAILFSLCIILMLFLLGIDYLNVKLNDVAPRYSKRTTTINKTIYYDTFFYDVIRCNTDEENETFKVIKNQKYNDEIIMKICN